MAFLTLQGWTVPIERGGSYEINEHGARSNAYDGTPLMTRTKTKRRWTFTSSYIDDDETAGLLGLLTGRGYMFKFDTSLYGTLGKYPSGTPVATITPAVDLQSSPASIYEESSGEREAPFDYAGSLWMGPSATNLLPETARDAESAPSGFTAVNGATLAAETSIRVEQSTSLKVTTAAIANSGFYAITGSQPAGTYTCSVLVYATEVLTLDIQCTSSSGPTSSNRNFSTVANAWTLVEITHTSTGTGTLSLYVRQPDATAGKVFYCDMLQVEEAAFATPWADDTRGNPELNYGSICGLSDDLTFSCWLRAGPSKGNNTYIFLTSEDADSSAGRLNSLVVFRRAGLSQTRVQFNSDLSTSATSFTFTTDLMNGEWHLFTLVVKGGDIYAYVDGSVVGSAVGSIHCPRLRGTQSDCWIGYYSAVQAFTGRLSEVMILPFALSATQITALAARTNKLPSYPKLEAAGDFAMGLDYDDIEVQGVPGKAEYSGAVDGGTYKEYMRKVSFSLDSEDDI